ncbi:MAG: tryptophan-rich sensory protein [Meiothermus sp.]
MTTRLLAAVALAATLVVNFMANALPIAGRTTGEVSDSFPVLFVPAGYVFTIWGLIYLGLMAFVVFQFRSTSVLVAYPRINRWFILSCVFNSLWILAWHYGHYGVTLLLMLGLLVSLIAIYQGLGARGLPFWTVRAPFSLYLGWIIVATVANATAVLYGTGWNGWGLPAAFWAVLMITVATGLGLGILWARGDLILNLVLVWALVGIALKQWGTPAVAYAAIAGAVVIVVALLLRRGQGGARAPRPE